MPQAKTGAKNPEISAPPIVGLRPGTEVMTLTGVRPVESLRAGDRIVTRTGACPLRGLMRTADRGYRLIFDAPQVVYLGDGQIESETGLRFAA